METSTRQIEQDIPFDSTCAWCLKNHGLLTKENQKEGDSHGACVFHAEMEYQAYKSKKRERAKWC